MSTTHGTATETAARLFKEWCGTPATEADGRRSPAGLWEALEAENLTLLAVPEERGGSGGSLTDAAAVLRLAGRHAAPAPLAETALLAGWALSRSSLRVPGGPLTAAPVRPGECVTVCREGGGWTLSGRLGRVPHARVAARLVVVGYGEDGGVMVAAVDPGACEILPGENLAGEARDGVVLGGARADNVAPAGDGVDGETLRLRGALARSILIVGALERVLDISVRHARERRQFGRPIGRFQAVQQQLALLAGEVAAAGIAADAAVEAAGRGGAELEIAAAKARVSEAAGTAAAIAHQVHGAIGFTERHHLGHFTRRLWAWRDEFGAESEWAELLGGLAAGRGPENLWRTLTALPPALG